MKSNKMIIQYYKWDIEIFGKLKKSISDNIRVAQIQSYMPIMALYFYYHNTPNSHKIIDFKRRYYIHNILNIHNSKSQYYNSNKILDGQIYDTKDNIIQNREMFLKILHYSRRNIIERWTIIILLKRLILWRIVLI